MHLVQAFKSDTAIAQIRLEGAATVERYDVNLMSAFDQSLGQNDDLPFRASLVERPCENRNLQV